MSYSGLKSSHIDLDLTDGFTWVSDLETRCVAVSPDEVLFIVASGEKIGCWGCFNLECVSGDICVTGADLVSSVVYQIRAPQSHSAVALCCPTQARASLPSPLPYPLQFPSSFMPGAVLRFSRPVRASGGVTSALFGPIQNDTEHMSDINWLKFCTSAPVEMFPLSWRSVLEESLLRDASSPPRFLISGHRGMGKSTWFRFVVNQLLARYPTVCLVDLDPGQAEIGQPGSVSMCTTSSVLLSPGFCTSKSLLSSVMSIIIPGVSPDRDVPWFKKCIAAMALAADFHLPIVVNTAGWVSGFGLEILHNAARKFKITTVFHLADSYDTSELRVPKRTVLTKLKCSVKERALPPTPLSAAVLRSISLGVHLGRDHAAGHLVEVCIANLCFVLYGGRDVPEDLVVPALMHSVVGLVASDSWMKRRGFCDELPEDGVLLSFGVVRGVSPDLKNLLVETALPPNVVELANVMVRAQHELPLSLSSPDQAYVKDAAIGGLGVAAVSSQFVMRGKTVRKQ